DRLETVIRFQLYALKPGEYSLPFEDPQGWHVVQGPERRKAAKIEYVTVRPLLEGQVRDLKTSIIATRLSDELRERFGVVYDTTNIACAAALFPVNIEGAKEGGGLQGVHFRTMLPSVAPRHTSRVLVRTR